MFDSDFLAGVSPADYNLPPTFTDWRPVQRDAIAQVVYGDRRFQALSVPTGGGKSLVVMSASAITGKRTVILTGTKGLQDQYTRDFSIPTQVLRRVGVPVVQGGNELADIRGKANYRCVDLRHLNCEDGQRLGCKCAGGPKCSYGSALQAARNAQVVITNYSFWFHINKQGAGLMRLPGAGPANPVEMLVLDEAHLAPEELAGFLAIRLYEREFQDLLHTTCPHTDDMKEWLSFAKEWLPTVKLEAKERGERVKKKGTAAGRGELEAVKRLESLADRLDRVAHVKDGWVCEEKEGTKFGRKWEFDPVWPGLYAERSLFCGVPSVVLMSATIRPKTMALLGVKSDQFEFTEWPRIFPANRSPIYHLPTVRLNWRVTDEQLRKWVERIDEIIESRLGRKGIIHTVSYARQDYLFRHSRFSQHFLGNTADPDSMKAAEVVTHFKQAQPPSILVSPSFSTGWDFPGEECEWQIISKIPFPDSQSKVMKARKEKDPQYLNYLAMQELVQACGRGMRAEWDRCECVSPETPILTADLRWVPAGELSVGDDLLAFDDSSSGRGCSRRWRWSKVIKAKTWNMPRVRVVYEGGEMVCTPNHPWLSVVGNRCVDWVLADSLSVGQRLVRLLNPWKSGSTFAEGWLSGFTDGEGCLVLRRGVRNPNATGVFLAQNDGPIYEKAVTTLWGLDFSCNVDRQRRVCRVKLLGGFPEILRFLGQIRPERLLGKFKSHQRNEMLTAMEYPKVLAIERLQNGPIASLQTSTKTFVANGMGAHNTFIVDDSIGWFLMQNKGLAPKWFQVRKMAGLPSPCTALHLDPKYPNHNPNHVKIQ